MPSGPTDNVARKAGPPESHNLALYGCSAVFVTCYLFSSLHVASTNPLWMDEILTVWAARLPSVSAIYSALLKGSEFSPPGLPVLLHFCGPVLSGSNLAFRIPSILSILLTGILLFVLSRRFLGDAGGILAGCLTLEVLSPFGLQARPYALVTFLFMAVLVLWDDLSRDNVSHRAAAWRIPLIALLLSTAISIHFYAVLFVPCIALLELLRACRTHKLRYSLWAAFLLAGASIFLWHPLMHALHQFSFQDVQTSQQFVARPTFQSLIEMYAYLFLGLKNSGGVVGIAGLIVLSVIASTALAGLYQRLRKDKQRTIVQPLKVSQERSHDLWTLVIGVLLFPIIVFGFSVIVTKTLYLRYLIAGVIGASTLLAEVLRGSPHFSRVGVPSALLFAAALNMAWGVPSMEFTDQTQVYTAMPGPYPIVLADSCLFFSFEESAPADFRSRMVYLTIPDDVPVIDAQCVDAIKRWKTINPALPVEDSAKFLHEHPRFYLLDEQTIDHTPGRYLSALHRIDLWKRVNGATLYYSPPLSTSDD